MGIAQDMLKVALEYATKNKARRITQFNVEMSAAADESEDSLRFYLESLTRGTLAEGAQVQIARVPTQGKCFDCAGDFLWTPDLVACPHCSSPRVRPVVHDEFRLTSIDVE
ncbi:MAG: hydrogenase maturation nickel metallochaperone HypA [Chloroflexi bacterium]|nr:hydrogenase maturation nickel metallochaperone HypA [Chloroflexota bacterium]